VRRQRTSEAFRLQTASLLADTSAMPTKGNVAGADA
jgi:hypothetical protein